MKNNLQKNESGIKIFRNKRQDNTVFFLINKSHFLSIIKVIKIEKVHRCMNGVQMGYRLRL